MKITNILNQIQETNNYMKKLQLTNELMEEVNSMGDEVSMDKKEDIMEELDNEGIDVRICSKCGNLMDEGYLIDGGTAYYCSDECLYSEITKEEWKKMTAHLIDIEDRTEEEDEWAEEYGDESFWTQWF